MPQCAPTAPGASTRWRARRREPRAATPAAPPGGRPPRPIHNASGFFMPSLDALDEVFAGTREGYFYTRDGNPTVRAFEEAVAALESAPLVGAFGSGMAAIYGALLAAGPAPGDRIVATQDLYGLTRVLLTTHFAELRRPDDVRRHDRPARRSSAALAEGAEGALPGDDLEPAGQGARPGRAGQAGAARRRRRRWSTTRSPRRTCCARSSTAPTWSSTAPPSTSAGTAT